MLEKQINPDIPNQEASADNESAEQGIDKREKGWVPSLINEYVGGFVHNHSERSTRKDYGHFEGVYTLEEIRDYLKKHNFDFGAINDHASNPSKPEILTADDEICIDLLKEAEKITALNKERADDDPIILSGVEANILFNEQGNAVIDVPDEVLEKLDLVVASRHQIDDSKNPQKIKESLEAAIANEYVDVIGHPDRYTRNGAQLKNMEGGEKKAYWKEYWDIWPELLQKMAENNKAFEINLNSPPSKKLIQMAAATDIKFSITFDAHDFNQYIQADNPRSKLVKDAEARKADGVATPEDLAILKNVKNAYPILKLKEKFAKGELTDEDEQAIQRYKESRLDSGPGVVAILRLARWLLRIKEWGVTPDRVISSSQENMEKFLTEDRGKTTQNIKNLTSK